MRKMQPQTSKKNNRWKDERHGFRHELRLVLVDDGFTYKQAKQIIDCIFGSIRERLKRKEKVTVDGFGAWSVVNPSRSQMWKFGRIIFPKPTVVFVEQSAGVSSPGDFKWSPHHSWKVARATGPKLRGKKLKLHLEAQEKKRHDQLFEQYKWNIRYFFDHKFVGNLRIFWSLRFNSPWFHNSVKACLAVKNRWRPVDETKEAIAETEIPISIDQKNIEVDYVQWYARWTSQLNVDLPIWNEAEKHISNWHLLEIPY